MIDFKLINRFDIPEIKEIHEKYYKEKFSLPDFFKFIRSYTFRNSSGKLVVAGGIRPILEVVAVTDKDASDRDKHDALYQLLWACESTARENGFKEIHCFPEHDSNWQRRLKRDGFKVTTFPAFVKEVKNG